VVSRLTDEVARLLTALAERSGGVAIVLDRAQPENELVVRLRPTVPSATKAELDIAVGSPDTVVMTFGQFGLIELVGEEPEELASHVGQLADAIMGGRVQEKLITAGGRPTSSEIRITMGDRAEVFHHAKLRIGKRERRVIDYVAY
jgi:hypothetical protein